MKKTLCYSFESGNKEIVELVISKCGSEWNDIFEENSDEFLEKACLSGNLEIVKLIVSYGNFKTFDWNSVFSEAKK